MLIYTLISLYIPQRNYIIFARAGHKIINLLLVTVIRYLLPLLISNNRVMESMSNSVKSNDLVCAINAKVTRYNPAKTVSNGNE